MTLTNPDSLLDKNGLAYYHSKIMQKMDTSSAVTINITQPEHSTINFYPLSGHDSFYIEKEESVGDTHVLYEAFPVNIYLNAERGYSAGEPVVSGDIITDELQDSGSYWQAFVYRGGTLNISATAETPVTQRTLTLHAELPALNNTYTLANEENAHDPNSYAYCYMENSSGDGFLIPETYFSSSDDIDIVVYDGDYVRFKSVNGNQSGFYNTGFYKSDSSSVPSYGSGNYRFYEIPINGSDETVTFKVQHVSSSKIFTLHGQSGSGKLTGSANAFTVNYSYVDANTGQTVTDSITSTTGEITFGMPNTSTNGNYTVTLPNGRVLYGSSSSSLTGSLDQTNYDFWTTNDTSVSTYEMVVGEDDGDGFTPIYGYMPGMSTGSFQCTAGYDDPSYTGFGEMIFGGMPLIGFVGTNNTQLTAEYQPAYKIFYNNELIYEATEGQPTFIDGNSILANYVGQTVVIKVY